MDLKQNNLVKWCQSIFAESSKMFENIQYDKELGKISMDVLVPNIFHFKSTGSCSLPFYHHCAFPNISFAAIFQSFPYHKRMPSVTDRIIAKLYTLTASSAKYIEIFFDDKNNFTVYFYNNKDQSYLMATIYANEKKSSLQLLPSSIKEPITFNDDLKHFQYASPDMVGKISKQYVFVSNLLINDLNPRIIYVDGLFTMKMFQNHPYLEGTGKHINMPMILDSLYQFSHLIVRNSNNSKQFSVIYKELGEINPINNETQIIIFDINIRFIKFIKFGSFKIILKNIVRVNKIDYSRKNDYKLLLNYNVSFAFYIDFVIEQYGNKCCEGKIGLCPTFLRCLL